MAEGLLDFFEFAAIVVLAAPVALLGVIRLTGGDPVGGVGLVAVAVGMVAFDRLVLGPREVVAKAIRSRVGGLGSSTSEGDE